MILNLLKSVCKGIMSGGGQIQTRIPEDRLRSTVLLSTPLRGPLKLALATHLPVDPAHQHRNDVALLGVTERPMRRDVMPL